MTNPFRYGTKPYYFIRNHIIQFCHSCDGREGYGRGYTLDKNGKKIYLEHFLSSFRHIQKTDEKMYLELLPSSWLAFRIQFWWTTRIFFNCELSFHLIKPNLCFSVGFRRNTA